MVQAIQQTLRVLSILVEYILGRPVARCRGLKKLRIRRVNVSAIRGEQCLGLLGHAREMLLIRHARVNDRLTLLLGLEHCTFTHKLRDQQFLLFLSGQGLRLFLECLGDTVVFAFGIHIHGMHAFLKVTLDMRRLLVEFVLFLLDLRLIHGLGFALVLFMLILERGLGLGQVCLEPLQHGGCPVCGQVQQRVQGHALNRHVVLVLS